MTDRAHAVVDRAQVAAARVVDRVTLDLDARRKRRHVVTTTGGRRLLVDLASVPQLANGDALALDDGGLVVVDAEPEALVEVTTEDPQHFAVVAWHLGNRHLPVQFGGDRLRLRRDHVIEAMLVRLGARLVPVDAPFDPEPGAYDHGPDDHKPGDHSNAGGHAHGHG
ncbi:MAG: urease accessory protein UreE [Pseudomonadota bacterium]